VISRPQAQELLEVVVGAGVEATCDDIQRCYAMAEQLRVGLDAPEGEKTALDWDVDDFVRVAHALQAWGMLQAIALKTEGTKQ
jgi:hypothetical protein